MKTKAIAFFAIASITIAGSGFLASKAIAQTPTAPITPVTAVRGEKHPEMRKALHALMNAQKFLQSAADDFGGHKASAMTATNNAIAEIKAALAYDRR